MRHWRPAHRCLYIIPEIHGEIDSIKIILSRILPLRFHDNQHDCVVLLGDYIDKGNASSEVLDLLIEAKQEYKDKFICLQGNHEFLFLEAMKSEQAYRNWMLYDGGMATIASYIKIAQLQVEPITLPYTRFLDIVPYKHIEFLQSLPTTFIIDDYLFFHGNIDDVFDMQLSKMIKQKIRNKENPLQNSKYIYVASHNYKSELPFIYSRYFMLGGSAPSSLILFELNSMTCAMIKSGKSRIYKHKFKFFE